MYFREQAKKVLCIRSTYDPTRKRCTQKVVISFDREADEVPALALCNLTNTEQQELSAWFEKRQAAKAQRINQQLLHTAAATLQQLSQAIKAMGENLSTGQAALTWKALSDVAKALRKVGHPQPKRKNKQRAPGLYRQADLLIDFED